MPRTAIAALRNSFNTHLPGSTLVLKRLLHCHDHQSFLNFPRWKHLLCRVPWLSSHPLLQFVSTNAPGSSPAASALKAGPRLEGTSHAHTLYREPRCSLCTEESKKYHFIILFKYHTPTHQTHFIFGSSHHAPLATRKCEPALPPHQTPRTAVSLQFSTHLFPRTQRLW